MNDKLSVPAQAAIFVSRARADENFYATGAIYVGQYTDRCGRANRCVGLVAFPEIRIPQGFEIARAFITLRVRKISRSCKSLQIRKLKDRFVPACVTWETRPEIMRRPYATARLCADACGREVSFDITKLVDGRAAWHGFALCADDDCTGALVFSADPATINLTCELREEHCPRPCVGSIENVLREVVFSADGTGEQMTPTVFQGNAQRTTVFARNLGGDDFSMRLQISPDGISFLDDCQIQCVSPGEIQALTPMLYAKYIRAKIIPAPGAQVSAGIWFQMQTRDYSTHGHRFDENAQSPHNESANDVR